MSSMRLFRKLLSRHPERPEAPVEIERIEHMLEYARQRNLCGSGTRTDDDRWVGNQISIVTEERSWQARKGNTVYPEGSWVRQYRSITWNFLPHHLGIYIVDGAIELRASHEGIGPREAMPIATNPTDLSEIRRCFDYWYAKFELPDSLGRPSQPAKKFEPSGNFRRDLELYLADGSALAFFDLFEDSNNVVWVDWREEDDRIVGMFADALSTNELSARFENEDADLLITYCGKDHHISYPIPGAADRDTTIISLNRILQPDYEFRLCNASQGSDTLAFMALPASEWALIEKEHAGKWTAHFTVIDETTTIFGGSG